MLGEARIRNAERLLVCEMQNKIRTKVKTFLKTGVTGVCLWTLHCMKERPRVTKSS